MSRLNYNHFVTRARTVATGRYGTTATSQMLQKTGMPTRTANFLDNGMSMGGGMGGVAVIRANRKEFPRQCLSQQMESYIMRGTKNGK